MALAGGLYLLNDRFGTVDAKLSGEWIGYDVLPDNASGDTTLARNLAAVKLTLQPSGKFELVDGGLPAAGEWRRKGDLLTLDVKTFMNRPLEMLPDPTKKAAASLQVKVRPDGSEIDFRRLTGPVIVLKRSGAATAAPEE